MCFIAIGKKLNHYGVAIQIIQINLHLEMMLTVFRMTTEFTKMQERPMLMEIMLPLTNGLTAGFVVPRRQ
jgi:hypothetical protein